MFERARASWRGRTRFQKLAGGLGGLVVLVGAAALAWTFLASAPRHPPGYALRSAPLLRIERAFVLTVGFAAVGVFCARLLAGDLPSGITTKGVEWVGEERIVAALQQAETSVDQLTAQSQAQDTAVATLRAELSDLQTHITGEVADTLENMRAAVGANAEAIGASNEGLASAHASIQNIMNVVQYLRNASEREAALNADNSTRITALEEASERLDARLVDLGDRLDEQLTDLRERITRMEQG